MFGHKYRTRSVESVLQELALYPRRPVVFYDANLGVDRLWLK